MANSPARKRQPRLPIEVRRQQVLDAALAIIGEEGYSAVSMDAIGRRVDVAKPVVYNAYPTLGELLRALLDRESASALRALADAHPPRAVDASGSGVPAAALTYWLEHIAAAILRDPAAWKLMITPPAETPAAVRDQVREGRAFAVAQLRSLVGDLLARHPRSADLDLDLAAEALLAVAESGARALLADPREETARRLVRFAVALLDPEGNLT